MHIHDSCARKDNIGIRHTFGTNAHLILGVVLQETLDTTAWELLFLMIG